MGENVDCIDREHHLQSIIDLLRVRFGVGVHPLGEGLEVATKAALLLLPPLLGTLRNTHGAQPAVTGKEALSPIFGGATARLTVQPQDQVAVTLHLCPAESAEQVRFAATIDVRNPPRIPEDFRGLGAARSASAQEAGAEQECAQAMASRKHAGRR